MCVMAPLNTEHISIFLEPFDVIFLLLHNGNQIFFNRFQPFGKYAKSGVLAGEAPLLNTAHLPLVGVD